MSVREKFAEKFSEEQAQRIEEAAEYHTNEVHSNKGSDLFKWALLICIGYECITRKEFMEYHRITEDAAHLKAWIRENAELGTHDGDCDYLSLFCGAYSEFVEASCNTPAI